MESISTFVRHHMGPGGFEVEPLSGGPFVVPLSDDSLTVSFKSVESDEYPKELGVTMKKVDTGRIVCDGESKKIAFSLELVKDPKEERKAVSKFMVDLYSQSVPTWKFDQLSEEKDRLEVQLENAKDELAAMKSQTGLSPNRRSTGLGASRSLRDVLAPRYTEQPGSVVVKKHTDNTALPVVRMLDFLQTLKTLVKEEPDMYPEESMGEIEYIIDILERNKMYAPEFLAKPYQHTSDKKRAKVDEESGKWLTEELTMYNRATVEPLFASVRTVTKAIAFSQLLTQKTGPALLKNVLLQSRMGETTPLLQGLLDKILDYDFDVFEFDEACHGEPLYTICMSLVYKHNLVSKLHLNEDKVRAFFKVVESMYRENPYHNHIHAADVVQTLSYYVHKFGHSLSSSDMLSIIIAGCVHDVDHPGTTNLFQIRTKSDLALIYNDQSVLENHHAATCFRIMSQEETDILDGIDAESRTGIRELIIGLVLATDMGRNFEYLGKFQTQLIHTDTKATFKPQNRDELKLMLQLFIKCADVSNPSKKRPVYMKWVDRVMTEFFRQGKEEERLSLPISPFMAAGSNIPKCQISFLNFLALPLFEMLGNFDERFVPILDVLMENRDNWKEVIAKEEAEAEAKAKAKEKLEEKEKDEEK
eukprot:TRINITY_DN14_c0_g3_i2.p1 TRINITY_DN14_c0_g3~~TRINITY_DN14_c0_g3_i2.p1  ORF type:complete len:645 (-),score=179.07 TRINITY_DN14_c0_g3_i2:305-2239(-)